jgi:acetyl esterase/lipase
MHPLLLTLALLPADDAKPAKELLWPKGAPGAVGTTAKDKPTLTAYLPAKGKRNGTAVVVCPGGGYGALAVNHEGKEVADWLVARGAAAFVLEYRLGPRYRHPAPLQDAQRAIRTVRHRARDLGLDAKKVGIWGFSAGGHLASSAATTHDAGKPRADDPIDRVSCRPDFAILCYPVISLEKPHAHWGSRVNLLGPKADDKLARSLSTHTLVTKDTPPVFLFHTRADKGVVLANSELFEKACQKAGVPVELVVYEKGPHGVGLGYKHPEVKDWPTKLEKWLRGRKLLGKEGS